MGTTDLSTAARLYSERLLRGKPLPSTSEQPARPATSDCPACHGVGWVHRELPISDPFFGKLVRCDVCGAGQQARWLDRQCNLKPDERQRRFSQWWTSTPERQAALTAAQALY